MASSITVLHSSPNRLQRSQTINSAILDSAQSHISCLPLHFPAFSVRKANSRLALRCKKRVDPFQVRAEGDAAHFETSEGSNWPLQLVNGLFEFFDKQYLLTLLLSGVIFGYNFPMAGKIANKWGLSRWSTFGIFLVSGLTLKWDEARDAMKAWPAALYGLVSILIISPLASIIALKFPLTPKELSIGLALFCCVPTTLSTGVFLSQVVGANAALALGMTVASNLAAILTMPFFISALVGNQMGATLPVKSLLTSLVITLLVPLLLGLTISSTVPVVGRWMKVPQNRNLMSKTCSTLLSLVPWMQVSSAQKTISMISPVQLAGAAIAGLMLHFLFILFNSTAVRILPLSEGGVQDNRVNRAVVLVASQKTLPVSVAVIGALNGTLGPSAILILPCIALHITQTIVDSALVSFWLDQDKKKTA